MFEYNYVSDDLYHISFKLSAILLEGFSFAIRLIKTYIVLGKLTGDEIEEVLKGNALGRLGCGNGKKIYVIPTNYVYDGRYIFAHATEGLKIQIMRAHPHVCFEVDEVQNFTNWRSVIAWGIFQELTDERSRIVAMKVFTENMFHLKVSADLHERATFESAKPVIYRIVIAEKTGRFEKE